MLKEKKVEGALLNVTRKETRWSSDKCNKRGR